MLGVMDQGYRRRLTHEVWDAVKDSLKSRLGEWLVMSLIPYFLIAIWDWQGAYVAYQRVLSSGLFNNAKAVLLSLAIGALFVLLRQIYKAQYRIYMQERCEKDGLLRRVENLEQKLILKIKLDAGNHLPNCHVKTIMWTKQWAERSNYTTGYSAGYTGSISGIDFSPITPFHQVRFLRLEVKAECIGSITGCSAKIFSIKKGDDFRFNGNDWDAPFAMGMDTDAFSKELKDKFIEHVDIIAITEDNRIINPGHNKPIPFTRDLQRIYADTGEYILHVVVAGSGVASAEAQLTFNWTGNWETATLEICNEANISAHNKF